MTMIPDTLGLLVPTEELAVLCRGYQVRELALFGSMLGPDHDSGSDIDLLVSFDPEARITFRTLAKLQRELEALLGRPVDLVPKDGLKPLIGDQVIESARVLYAA